MHKPTTEEYLRRTGFYIAVALFAFGSAGVIIGTVELDMWQALTGFAFMFIGIPIAILSRPENP